MQLLPTNYQMKAKDIGLKVATNEYDVMAQRLEQNIKAQKIDLEINEVVLEYLKSKK